MKYLLGKTSPMFVISGFVKIAAGIAICLWPVIDFSTLIYLFGIPSLVQGSLHIITAAQYRNMYDNWWTIFLMGIVYMVAGVITISYADITPQLLMIIIAITWATAGFIMMLLAWRLNKEMQSELGLFLSGALSIFAGVYLLTSLHADIFSILWVVVIYSFLIGILTTLFGVKAKAWQHVYFDDIME
jgi:uncharacterized membrane protein HdeD (DUF308 family)